MIAWYGTPEPMNFRLRQVADVPVPEATDFSESVFDELQERVARRTQTIMENRTVPEPKVRARMNWSSYRTMEDWKALYEATPEWKGLSPFEIQKDVDSGGYAFYGAFHRWLRKVHPDDPTARKAAIDDFFPRVRTDWSGLKDLESWKRFHESRPDWRGLSTGSICDVEGGNAFYQAFSIWCASAAKGDEPERRRLVESIFPPAHRSWKEFVSLDDWKRHFTERPEWAEPEDLDQAGSADFSAFRGAYSNWCRTESAGDERRRLGLYETLFPSSKPAWSAFRTIGEWSDYWKTRPEWHGKTGEELRLDAGGAGGFHQAFKKWCKKEAAGDEAVRIQLVETLFPVLQYQWSLLNSTLEDWVEHFNARPEWHGLSTSEMQLEAESGGHAFYQAFKNWCKKEAAGNEAKRRALRHAVFPPRGKNRWTFED